MIDKLFHFNGWSFKIGPINITFTITGIIEILIFAVLIYYVIRWIKRSKAWNLLKGAVVLIVVFVLAWVLGFNNLTYIFKVLFNSLLVAIIVIFQPEIRKALAEIGEKNPIGKIIRQQEKVNTTELTADSVEKIVSALAELGKNKVGALIILERKILLDDVIATGIPIDAEISSALLQQLFVHNTPLHDGAVVIRHNRIVAATCYLPLSQDTEISKDLGTRHRAGLGISEVSDCVTLIASEETGFLSVAINGELQRNISTADLRDLLNETRLIGEVKTKKTEKPQNSHTSFKKRSGRKNK